MHLRLLAVLTAALVVLAGCRGDGKSPPGVKARQVCEGYMYERGRECRSYSAKTRRILGGEIVKDRNKYPHMASISIRGKHICGGSLISERFVLTAAHCFKGDTLRQMRRLRVTLGRTRLRDRLFDQQVFAVRSVHVPARGGDIALARLHRAARFGDHVRPACLHTRRRDPNTDAVATGWGKTDRDRKMRANSDLYEVSMEFRTKQCKLLYKNKEYGIDKKNYICASGKARSQNICKGDSGGPLQLHSDCISSIVGVTALSPRLVSLNGSEQICAGNFAKFTRVAPYLGWIEAVVWPDRRSTARSKHGPRTVAWPGGSNVHSSKHRSKTAGSPSSSADRFRHHFKALAWPGFKTIQSSDRCFKAGSRLDCKTTHSSRKQSKKVVRSGFKTIHSSRLCSKALLWSGSSTIDSSRHRCVARDRPCHKINHSSRLRSISVARPSSNTYNGTRYPTKRM